MTLLIDGLCVFRLFWLWRHDTLTERPRNLAIRLAYRTRYRKREQFATLMSRMRHHVGADFSRMDAWEHVVEADDNPPKLAYLLTCSWCFPLWIAAGVGVLRANVAWWPTVSLTIATAAIASLVAAAVNRFDA